MDKEIRFSQHSLFISEGDHVMKKIRYSKDVDAMLIELSDKSIAYAEEEGQMILHYSNDNELVLIEILDVKFFLEDNSNLKITSNQSIFGFPNK